jgi:hypothetical protein
MTRPGPDCAELWQRRGWVTSTLFDASQAVAEVEHQGPVPFGDRSAGGSWVVGAVLEVALTALRPGAGCRRVDRGQQAYPPTPAA